MNGPSGGTGSGIADFGGSSFLANNNEGGSSGSRRDDGMKVCRGPFNVNCTTNKEPQVVLLEMVKSLEQQKISYKKVGNYGLRCQKNNVRFEMEIAHLDNLDNIYIVKFKRLAGETTSYKEVSNKVLNNMHLQTTHAY